MDEIDDIKGRYIDKTNQYHNIIRMLRDVETLIKRVKELEFSITKLKEAANRVFKWYFIFGEDNDAAREHLAHLGNVLKELDEFK